MGEHEQYQPSLARLAGLAVSRPSLMSSLMQLYREREGMDEEQLAAFLECDSDALPRLALCRRPRKAPDFRGDIEAIATHTGADPTRLARLVRAAESQEALGDARGAGGPSILMAARDYDDTASEDSDTSQNDEATEDDSR
ncbi:MAG: hypothetical protein QOH93_3574 [Chloroflexia bacterium]|nr:hypothetical protein [Chloroflexia bacterium]